MAADRLGWAELDDLQPDRWAGPRRTAETESEEIGRQLAAEHGLEWVDLGQARINPEAASLIPAVLAREHRALPFAHASGDTLLVAVADPSNVVAVDDIAAITGLKVELVVAAPEAIKVAIDRTAGLEDDISEPSDEELEDGDEADALLEAISEEPVVRAVNSILAEAAAQDASDIYLVATDSGLSTSYRVDGVLVDGRTVGRKYADGVISRIKLLAELDIAERRRPQGGQFTRLIGGEKYDIRIVSLPSSAVQRDHAESIVLRPVGRQAGALSLDEIGLDDADRHTLERALANGRGLILAAGPMGAGKTTTLYACLRALDASRLAIVTIEDPAERPLHGITQVEISDIRGLGWMEALKHTVRAALDVLMVGEIRDRAPGEAAVSAAGTGTLVLSTIHADSAAGAVARLLDMGIAPYLVSETLRCTIAQRLVRRLCEHCREPTELVPADLESAGLPATGNGALPAWRGAGCEVCGQTGYRGRVALFEVLRVDEDMKALIREKASTEALNAHAVRMGMSTLASSALTRISRGETSLDEVIRVLGMGS